MGSWLLRGAGVFVSASFIFVGGRMKVTRDQTKDDRTVDASSPAPIAHLKRIPGMHNPR